MAVKKCDETPADHVDEEGEEVVEEEECEPGFHKENGICVPNVSHSPSKIRIPVTLGKTLESVEALLYADYLGLPESRLSRVPDFGAGQLTKGRPPTSAGAGTDSFRGEARKFHVLNEDGQMVYINSSFNQGSPNATTVLTTAYGSPPFTITRSPGAGGTPTEVNPAPGDMFKKYHQNLQIESTLFERMLGPTESWDPAIFDAAWLVFVGGTTTRDQETLVRATGLTRPSPLIDTTRMFTDHYTNIHIPFSTEEMERYINNLNTPMYVDIESKYNFYSKAYEEGGAGRLSTTTVFTEWRLPNLYSIMSQDGSSTQTALADLGIGSEYVQNINKVYLSQAGQGMMPTGQALAPWMELADHYQNIGIPSSQVEILLQGSDFDDLHPMNTTVELKTDKTGEFLNAAETANMTDNLLKYIMNETITWSATPTGHQGPRFTWSTKLPFALSREKVVDRPGTIPAVLESQQSIEELFVMDLQTWLSAYFDSDIDYAFPPAFSEETILLGIPDFDSGTSECNAFRDVLQTVILVGKINQIVNDYFRTFEEMLEGKEAYNEVLIYEIVQKSANAGAAELQRIFIPNTEKLDILKYIDTQVKYDKEYTYEIFAHNLIVGTQYKYSTLAQAATYISERKLEFGVEYEPSLKIVRIPIYSENVRVLDSAPVWPNVELIPYKGVPNQFLINLSSNVGDYDIQPIIINSKDAVFARKYRQAHKLFSDEPINFKSDDPVQRFEIYRMDTPPGSYKDFSGHLIAIASSKTATAVSHVENIEPNQKYYYMFRGIDIHQNRSNPTEVYQVEITEFNGMMFFNQRIYDFEDRSKANNNINSSRDFRRYLKINPNLVQSIVNYDKTFPPAQGNVTDSAYNANNVVLGQADEPVWGKKFKIRITSKNSGRKFDLNLTCKATYDKVTKPN